MDNNEITLPSADLALAKKEVGTDSFQPHLILLHPGSGPCKSDEGKPPKGQQGHYFAADIDFGPSVNVVHIGSRWHALLKVGGTKTKESFNLNSVIYTEIKNTHPEGQQVQPKWGVSHLLFLPSHSLFVIFHPNTKTARKAGYEILLYSTPLDNRDTAADKALPVTNIMKLYASFIEKVANPFYKPEVDPLVMDFFKDVGIVEPTKEEIQKQIDLFRAPLGREPKVTESTGVER